MGLLSMFIFFQAIILGFIIGAIVGPIGVLCIKRSISEGFIIGLSTGIGAAIADALYASVAAFGIAIVASFLLTYNLYFRIIGGFYLLYLGYTAYHSQVKFEKHHATTAHRILPAVGSTFFLTLINPTTICSFAILFTNVRFEISTPYAALLIVSGIFVGSTLWWIILSSLGAIMRHKFNTKTIGIINKLSGIIICAFGIASLLSVILPK